jgi:RNA-binding protein 8A
VIFVTNLHEEITEDELYDHFADCGPIKTLNLPLDRRTGYPKGYAIIEYSNREVAQTAIDTMNNACIMEKEIIVTWCFVKPEAPKIEEIELNTE